MDNFSAGLGEGLGYSIRYLPDKFEEIISKNGEFAKGVGIGFGDSFQYLTPRSENKVIQYS